MRHRLFLHIWSLEMRRLLEYRTDFWLNALASFAAQLALAYYVWQAVFSVTAAESVGGYAFDALVGYYVLVTLVGKLVHGEARQSPIAEDIYQGTLNRFLVYPTSYFGCKYAEHLGNLAPAFVQLAVFGLAAHWILPDAETMPTAGDAFLALVAVLVGNLLYFSMLVGMQLVAFWAEKVWSLLAMLRFTAGILGGMILPLELFGDRTQSVLAWLPFRYVYAWPVATLQGRVSLAEWLAQAGGALAWTLVIAFVARLVWRRGLAGYSGIGI